MGDRWIGMLLKLFFFFFLEGGSFLWRRLCLVSVAMDPIYNTPITHYRGYSSYCDVRGTKQTCMSNWLTHRLCLQIVSLGKDCAGGVWLQRNSKIASSDLNFHLQSHENVGHRTTPNTASVSLKPVWLHQERIWDIPSLDGNKAKFPRRKEISAVFWLK